MSDDPTPAGLGGFDMNALLQQAQQMQEQMMSAQQELADTTVSGTVGDGLVSVSVNGIGELVGVRIRKDSFDPADTEDLEDLIVAAYRDAKSQVEELASEKLGPLSGAAGEMFGAPGPDGPDTAAGGLPPGF
ncbi:MAG TPA: YbaB/EbfC family nucleoid-associated protein [Nocardioidaceae bacterium]|jgi:DNA-binding YbaB/EbfC family protein|nr:YbaB/EbfC family nucleoid-associated protein [Nocardioidaceae bacterium]